MAVSSAGRTPTCALWYKSLLLPAPCATPTPAQGRLPTSHGGVGSTGMCMADREPTSTHVPALPSEHPVGAPCPGQQPPTLQERPWSPS